MLEHLFHGPQRIQELREGPRGALFEGFARELLQAGYPERPARRHIRAAEHLLYWSEREGEPISNLTKSLLGRFSRHVRDCRCPGYGRSDLGLSKGARLFEGYLRSTGLLTTPVEPSQEPPLFVAFREWMKQQRGTSDSTLADYGLPIRALLARLGDDPSSFDAQGLRQFVLEASRRSGWATAKRYTTALRMFLRFLISEGTCPDTLEGAVPVVAHWRLSSLPRYLLPGDVERVIASCDGTPVGKRNRAILLLLARMGLRAGDIVRLRLDDIDWKEPSVRVCGKGRLETRLPLTQEVGDAIVDYLQTGRPHTDEDALFVLSCAPFRAFASHCAISMIVVRAMRRAGVVCPSRGAAHVLRHSAATAMLWQGASLQEIASVLRHRSIETTQIYAKVDVTALQQIAQAWPEVHPC